MHRRPRFSPAALLLGACALLHPHALKGGALLDQESFDPLVFLKGKELPARGFLKGEDQWFMSLPGPAGTRQIEFDAKELEKLAAFDHDAPLALRLDPTKEAQGKAVLERVGMTSSMIFYNDVEYNLDDIKKTDPLLAQLEQAAAAYEADALAFYSRPRADRDLPAFIASNERIRELIQHSDSKWTGTKFTRIVPFTARFHHRLEDDARRAYKTMADHKAAQVAVQTHASLEEKAIYDRNDNYKPVVYKNIYDWRRACVAVVPPGQNAPIGSGVIIGLYEQTQKDEAGNIVKDDAGMEVKEKRGLVLTCLHVISGLKDIDDLMTEEEYQGSSLARWQVWIGHEDGATRIDCRVEGYVHQGQALDGETAPLDFALVSISFPPDILPADLPAPLPLSQESAVRWDPLVIIGFPQRQTQWVHDNSWVLLPYSRMVSQLDELRQQITVDFLNDTQKEGAASTSARKFIEKHYVKHPSIGNMRLFVDSWKDDGMLDPIKVHAIAVESDTFRGNSGSPAIHRLKGRVLGILQRGQPDGNVRVESDIRKPENFFKPGATIHEALLPVEAIIRQLNDPAEGLPGWKQRYKVTIK